jgi:uncharacterized protein DUF1579
VSTGPGVRRGIRRPVNVDALGRELQSVSGISRVRWIAPVLLPNGGPNREEAGMADNATQPQMPTPDPALRRLDRFVGTWSMEGHLVGFDENNIKGKTSYQWLPGGFFLEQRVELDFMGLNIHSLELIGYDPETKTFPSTVYSNLSPAPLPYRWEIGENDTVTISVSYGPLDATFNGVFSDDGQSFGGGWRPNPGADETVNVPYDISGHRVK